MFILFWFYNSKFLYIVLIYKNPLQRTAPQTALILERKLRG